MKTKRILHVGASQIVSAETVAETLFRIDRQAKIAALVGVDTLLFAEGVLHGFDYEITAETLAAKAEPVDGASGQVLLHIARTTGVTLLVGMFERDGSRFHNTHAVYSPKGIVGLQRKSLLTANETAIGLVPGPVDRAVFTFNGVKTAIYICADSAIKDRYQTMRQLGVEHFFLPTGGGGRYQDYLRQDDLDTPEGMARFIDNHPKVYLPGAFSEEARREGIGSTACNTLGRAGANTCHQGHMSITDSHGIIRAQKLGTNVLDHQEETLIHARLSF